MGVGCGGRSVKELKKYQNELYEIEFDKLSFKEQQIICEMMILNHDALDNIETFIFDSFNKFHIIYDNNEIYGYKLINDNNKLEYFYL